MTLRFIPLLTITFVGFFGYTKQICFDYFSKNSTNKIGQADQNEVLANLSIQTDKIDKEINELLARQKAITDIMISARRSFGYARDKYGRESDEYTRAESILSNLGSTNSKVLLELKNRINQLVQMRLSLAIETTSLLPIISELEMKQDTHRIYRGTLLRRLKFRLDGNELFIENLFFNPEAETSVYTPIDFTGLSHNEVAYYFAKSGFAADPVQEADRLDAVVIAVPIQDTSFAYFASSRNKVTLDPFSLSKIPYVKIYRLY